jgi:hypothetical protein
MAVETPKRPESDIASKLYRDYLSSEQGKTPESFLSREYQLFAKKKTTASTIYEMLCQISGKIYKYPVSPEQKDEIDTIFRSFDYSIEAEDALSFSLLAFVFMTVFGALLLLFSAMFGVMLIIGAFGSLLYFRSYPRRLIEIRRSKVSTEIILSILYIVIYMRNISNLEAAVRFAADNLEGPLAVDYSKMLWDVQIKKYADIGEALNTYLQQWKKYNEAFVDSIYLIETSLVQKSEDRRIMMLDQALKRILDGTFETMVHYVNDLRTPVSAVFMLGITLPIMGLVMLPLIGSFMANLLSPSTLFIFYDIILPVVVIIMINQILATRPTAFPQIDLTDHPLVPPEDHFVFFGRNVHAAIPAVIVFIAIATPYLWYAATVQSAIPNENDVVYSCLLILAIGFSIATYCKLATDVRVKIRQDIKGVENDFAYAVFQIGNRLSEGVPAEIAMVKTATTMKESNVSFFIRKISDNIQKLGLDLYRAIFDKTYGAIILYPSSLVRSVMKIFVESVKESEEIAASSLMHTATYLQSVHNIEEKIKDVLSETLSTLKFQSAFIAPLISGIIVGLTSMILIILSVLGSKITAATSAAEVPSTIGGGASAGLGGSVAFGFFQMSNTIPLPFFQIIVGIYLIEIVIISTILASKIEFGDDHIQELDSVQKALWISIIIYFIVAVGVTIAFSGMAHVAIAIGSF